MNIVNEHAHADYGHGFLSETDYYNLLKNVIDTHESIGKIINKKLLAKLIKNRTYIFEKAVF
jgi:hypothetical protein